MREQKDDALISVIVPTYNQSQYLPICLDSIMFQEYPNIEVIVVNDGSTDDTIQSLDDYQKRITTAKVSYACNYNETTMRIERCHHFRYPIHERQFRVINIVANKGLGCTLNLGFQQAKGKYCTFIASDDMLLPSMIGELAFILDQGADFAYADMHIVDDFGRILRRFSLPDYSFENAFCNWYLCGVCKLYRRELHDQVGYYDERIKPQDHEMFLRFAMHGARFVHLPKVLANVRIHADQRQKDNHLPANWNRLYKESATLVCKARQHLIDIS